MQQGIDVEIAGAGSDVEEAAVGRQVGFGFIRPEGVEALADYVVTDDVPKPLRRFGVGGVDVGAGAIIGQAVGRRAVRELLEPALLHQEVVVARAGREAGPDADHGLEAQVVKLAIHGDRVRPFFGVQVHLAHLGVIEPVDHENVSREVALAVALGDGQYLILRGIALLALNETISRFRQHGRGPGKLAVTRVDLIGGATGDDEERHAVADLRRPPGLLVEARLDGGLRGVVPDHSVATIGDHEGHTNALSAGSVVVMPALDGVTAMVEEPFLILPQTIVVLVIGRSEGRADLIEGRIRSTPFVQDASIGVLVIGHGHRPTRQLQEDLALGRADGDVSAWGGAAEKLRNVQLRRHRLARTITRHRNHQTRGPIDIPLVGLLVRPALGGRSGDETVAGRRGGLVFEQAQADANDVRGVRLKNDGAATSIQEDLGLFSICRSGVQECESQHDC